MKIRIAPVVFASISLLTPMLATAQDGAAMFKTRCAPCHGTEGQGKPNMAPKLAGTSKDVSAVLIKGGLTKSPHMKPMTTLSSQQVSTIAAFVKTLQ